MTIEETQREIVEEFTLLDDWMDRYQMLIDMGGELPVMPQEYKTPENLIDGCQSRVWIVAHVHDGIIRFDADSDALIVKGIIALLLRVYNGHTAQEIVSSNTSYLDDIGLREHLSPTRSNGLGAMIKEIMLVASTVDAGGIKELN